MICDDSFLRRVGKCEAAANSWPPCKATPAMLGAMDATPFYRGFHLGSTKVRDVMTKHPVCCVPSDTVQHVASLMRDKDVGCLPVVEEHTHGGWWASLPIAMYAVDPQLIATIPKEPQLHFTSLAIPLRVLPMIF
jgi:hypothetical protein